MQKVHCTCDETARTIKNIYVFVNGAKYEGQKFVLSQKRWHHILNQITCKLDPYFGKVEKLYTTTSGLTVYSFTDLENNATYVASNKTRKYSPVKGGYTFDTEPSQEYFEHYLSSHLQRVNKYKKLVYVRRDLLVIYIFRNGECQQSFKIVLTNDDLSSWSHILSYIAMILDVPERCIKSLYSVSGNKICGPWELQHGASYVAVGYNESFRKGCYRNFQKTTEILLSGYPVVPKDKNLACTHKVRKKMKPFFRWNHYDQYNCVSAPIKKPPRECQHCKKMQTQTQTNVFCCRSEVSSVAPQEEKPKKMSVSTGPKRNKKVTVHMRIKNPQASNLTVTRNSGDSSPSSRKYKTWECSSDTDTDYSSRRICPASSKKAIKKCKSCSPTTSSSESSCKSNKKTNRKSLTWKHVKKGASETSEDDKVTVKVKGGKAIVLDGTASGTDKSCKDKETCSSIWKKYLEAKINAQKAKTQDCSKTCAERKSCKTYKISAPPPEKENFECAGGSRNNCPPSTKQKKSSKTPSKTKDKTKDKEKNKKSFWCGKKKSDASESMTSVDSTKRKCRKCEQTDSDAKTTSSKTSNKTKTKKKSFCCRKKKSPDASESMTSVDTTKPKCRKCEEIDSYTEEDESSCDRCKSKRRSSSSKRNRNNSECTICRIQHEYKRINKRY